MTRGAILISLCWFLTGCGGDPFNPDLSSIPEVQINVERFEQDLFALDTNHLNEGTANLEKKYGSFYVGFCETIILGGRPADSTLIPTLKLFISHPDMRQVYDASQKIYPGLSSLETQISHTFRLWRYYFPETHTLPSVYSMVSGLNLPMSVSDSAIGIGIDMYLGKDNEIYELAQFEKYRRRNMNEVNILPDLIRAMGMTILQAPENGTDLLSEMVYQGKVQFLIDLMAPQLPDSQKFGYSAEQFEWCVQNESNIWGFLVKDRLMFTTESQRIAQFINDGPFTSGLNKTSPARTGIWIGWRIVRSWIDKHGIEKFREMLKTPAQQLLNESGYKP